MKCELTGNTFGLETFFISHPYTILQTSSASSSTKYTKEILGSILIAERPLNTMAKREC